MIWFFINKLKILYYIKEEAKLLRFISVKINKSILLTSKQASKLFLHQHTPFYKYGLKKCLFLNKSFKIIIGFLLV